MSQDIAALAKQFGGTVTPKQGTTPATAPPSASDSVEALAAQFGGTVSKKKAPPPSQGIPATIGAGPFTPPSRAVAASAPAATPDAKPQPADPVLTQLTKHFGGRISTPNEMLMPTEVPPIPGVEKAAGPRRAQAPRFPVFGSSNTDPQGFEQPIKQFTDFVGSLVKHGDVPPDVRTAFEALRSGRATQEDQRKIDAYMKKSGDPLLSNKGLHILPFIGVSGDIQDALAAYAAQGRIDAGNGTDEDKRIVAAFQQKDEQEQRKSAGYIYKALSALWEIPAFVMEIAATGGGKQMVQKFAEKSLDNLLLQSTKEAIGKKAIGAAPKVVAELARDVVAAAQRAVNMAIGDTIPGADDEDQRRKTLAETLPHAFVSQTTEYATEAMGGILEVPFKKLAALTPAKKLAAIREGMAEVLMGPKGEGMRKILADVAKATNWNGPLGELLEERAADILHALDPTKPTGEIDAPMVRVITGQTAPGDDPNQSPRVQALRQFVADSIFEAAVFSVPSLAGAVVSGVDYASKAGQRAQQAARDAARPTLGKDAKVAGEGPEGPLAADVIAAREAGKAQKFADVGATVTPLERGQRPAVTKTEPPAGGNAGDAEDPAEAKKEATRLRIYNAKVKSVDREYGAVRFALQDMLAEMQMSPHVEGVKTDDFTTDAGESKRWKSSSQTAHIYEAQEAYPNLKRGTAGAGVYHDIQENGRFTQSRKDVEKAIERYLQGGPVTSLTERIVRVARRRAFGTPKSLGLPPLVGQAMEGAGRRLGEVAIPRRMWGVDDSWEAEEKAASAVEKNPAKFVKLYRKAYGRVLSADDASELFPSYAKSADSRRVNLRAVRGSANAVVEMAYDQMIREVDKARQEGTDPFGDLIPGVVFLAGGQGSGKSTTMTLVPLADQNYAIFDSTFHDYQASSVKMDQAREAGLGITVVDTYRDPVQAWVNGVIPRMKETGRPVTITQFVRAHKLSHENVLRFAAEHPDELTFVYENFNDAEGKQQFEGRDLDWLKEKLNGYDAERLTRELVAWSRAAAERGDITPEQFRYVARGVETADARAGQDRRGGRDTDRAKQGQVTDRLYQDDDVIEADLVGPVWYSELTRQIEGLKTNAASPQEWAGIIQNLKGVKKDEIEWSGILDWLKLEPFERSGLRYSDAAVLKIRASQTGDDFDKADWYVAPRTADNQGPPHQLFAGRTALRLQAGLSDEQMAAIDATPWNERGQKNVKMPSAKPATNQVTKAQILDYLAKSGVEVVDTVYTSGGGNPLVATWHEWAEHTPEDKYDDVRQTRAFQLQRRGGRAYTFVLRKMKDGRFDLVRNGSHIETFGARYDEARFLAAAIERVEDLEFDDPSSVNVRNATQFDDSTALGGDNYTELLLRFARKSNRAGRRDDEVAFEGGHWGNQADVLVHVRFKTDMTPAGKKVLRVEEIQSDWAQAGHNKGWHGRITDPAGMADRLWKRRENGVQNLVGRENADEFKRVVAEAFKNEPEATTDSVMWRLREILQDFGASEPNATSVAQRVTSGTWLQGETSPGPFVMTTAYTSLAWKRIIRWAAEHGFDGVALMPGEVQNERGNIADRIEALRWIPNVGIGVLQFKPRGGRWESRTMEEKELPQYIGADVAKRLLEAPLTEVPLRFFATVTHVPEMNYQQMRGLGVPENALGDAIELEVTASRDSVKGREWTPFKAMAWHGPVVRDKSGGPVAWYSVVVFDPNTRRVLHRVEDVGHTTRSAQKAVEAWADASAQAVEAWADASARPNGVEPVTRRELTLDPDAENVILGGGHNELYDKILVKSVNQILERFGGKRVETKPVELMTWDRTWARTPEKRSEKAVAGKLPVHYFDITKELRKRALEGLPLFQKAEPAPIWYSDLVRQIEVAKVATMSAQEWGRFITGLKGVKYDEIKWSGILDWLEDKPQEKMPKASILDFLAKSGVQVKESLRRSSDDSNEPEWVFNSEWEPMPAEQVPDLTKVSPEERAYHIDLAREWFDQTRTDEDDAPDFDAAFKGDPRALRAVRRLAQDRLDDEAEHSYQIRRQFWVTLNEDGKTHAFEVMSDHDAGIFEVIYRSGDTFEAEPIRQRDTNDNAAVQLAAGRILERLGIWKAEYADVRYARFGSDQFVAPGGRDYTELILTLPAIRGREVSFFSTEHWDEENNPLVHVRFKTEDITNEDGTKSKSLRIEEIQSDWAQHGHDLGWKPAGAKIVDLSFEDVERLASERGKFPLSAEGAVALKRAWDMMRGEKFDGQQFASVRLFHEKFKERLDRLMPEYGYYESSQRYHEAGSPKSLDSNRIASRVIPDERNWSDVDIVRGDIYGGQHSAPFVMSSTSYTALIWKRIIRWAADNGFDSINLMPGSVQNERWNAGRWIDEVTVIEAGDGEYYLVADNNGELVLDVHEPISKAKLRQTIGTDLANRVLELEPRDVEVRLADPFNGRDSNTRSVRARFRPDGDWREAVEPKSGLSLVVMEQEPGSTKWRLDRATQRRVPNEIAGRLFKSKEEGFKFFEKYLNDNAKGSWQTRTMAVPKEVGEIDKGHKTLYDEILVNVANDVLKSLGGGKAEWKKVKTKGIGNAMPDGKKAHDVLTGKAPRLVITMTPELKKRALQGLPLFQREQAEKRSKVSGRTMEAWSVKALKDSFQLEQDEAEAVDAIARAILSPAELRERIKVGVKAGDVWQDALFQRDTVAEQDQNTPLMVSHNLTPEKLRQALKMGGLVMPSVAAVPVDRPVTSYGPITFLAPASMAHPSRTNRWYRADAYTETYPSIRKLYGDDAAKKLMARIREGQIATGNVNSAGYVFVPDLDELGSNGGRALSHEGGALWTFLKERGIEPNIGEEKIAENYESRRKAERKLWEQIDDAGLMDAFDAWSEELVASLPGRNVFFAGWTNMGRKRWKDNTPENVVAWMKKQRREDLKGGGNSYGVGQIRARLMESKKFKSRAQIKKASGKLVTKAQMTEEKERLNGLFSDLVKQTITEGTPFAERMRRYESVAAAIEDVPRMGIDRAFKEYSLPSPNHADVRAFIKELMEAPTEYFEGKIEKAVPFQDFAVAIVPSTLDQELKTGLERLGLDVVEYDATGTEAEREAARSAAVTATAKARANELVFQRQYSQFGTARGMTEFMADGTGVISGLNDPNVSTAAHELAHVIRRFLFNRNTPVADRAGITDEDIQIIETWCNVHDGQWYTGSAETGGEEKFARGWERYLRDGKAPTPALNPVFQKLSGWLRTIYRALVGSPINVQIPVEVREVFDRLVTRQERLRQQEAAAARAAGEDRLSTGERQARLPGDVGDIRDREVEHPTFELPPQSSQAPMPMGGDDNVPAGGNVPDWWRVPQGAGEFAPPSAKPKDPARTPDMFEEDEKGDRLFQEIAPDVRKHITRTDHAIGTLYKFPFGWDVPLEESPVWRWIQAQHPGAEMRMWDHNTDETAAPWARVMVFKQSGADAPGATAKETYDAAVAAHEDAERQYDAAVRRFRQARGQAAIRSASTEVAALVQPLSKAREAMERAYLAMQKSEAKAAQQAKRRGGGETQERLFQDAPQTDTPAFKRWFGRSVVVNEDGSPMVMYHGTTADFSAFSHAKAYSGEGGSQSGSGFYFTSSPESASGYASNLPGSKVIPVYLAITNPLEIDFITGEVSGAKLSLTKKQVRKIIMSIPNIRSVEDSPLLNFGDIEWEGFESVLNAAVNSYSGGNNIAALRNDFFTDSDSWLRALADATGHDGAVSVTGSGIHYVAWRPEQIKSAIGNSGEFDPSNPDILFQDAPQTDTPAFKRWFGRSVIVNPDGSPRVMYHGGSFDESMNEDLDDSGLGVHFGSKYAALERIGGKMLDDGWKSIDIEQDEDNQWWFTTDYGDSEESYNTKDDAREAAEQFVRDEVENREPSNEEAVITQVYLAIANPLRLPDLGTWKFQGVVRSVAKKIGLSKSDVDAIYAEWNLSSPEGWDALKRHIEKAGYDGIVYRNTVEDKGTDSYIALRAGQVKSVNNQGGFDGNNPNVLFQNDSRPTKTKEPVQSDLLKNSLGVEKEVPESAGNINLTKFDIPDEAKRTLEDIFQENDDFLEQRRGVRTWEDTEAAAQAIPMPKTVPEPGKAFNAEQLEALGGQITATRLRLEELNAKIAGGNADAMDQAKYAALLTQETVLLETYAGATAEAGRALNILRKMRKAIDTSDQKLLAEAVKFMGGSDHLEKVAKYLAAMPKDDLIGKYRFVRSLYKPGIADWLTWYWYANLMSGPRTHASNIFSNSGMLAYGLVSKPFAGAVDLVRSKVTGTDRAVRTGEIPMELIGAAHGAMIGARKGLFLLKNGYTLDDVANAEFRKEVPGGLATNFVSRSMEAADLFFRMMAYHAELYGQAYTAAKNKGLKEGSAEGQAFVAQFLARPPKKAVESAERESKRQVFRQEEKGPIVKAFNWMRRDFEITTPSGKVRKVWNPMRVIIPFVDTPANIMKMSVEATPIGLLTAPLRETTRERSKSAGRAVLGTLLLAPLVDMAIRGLVTGSGPDDKELRDALYRTGWQPNSIKIGDRYYSYQTWTPMALPLSTIANMVETYTMTGKAPSPMTVVAKTLNSVLQQSYLSGLSALQDALDDPERYADAFARKLATSAMPLSSLQGQVARATDPTIRQPDSVLESIKANVPGKSRELPARTNVFGEESKRESGLSEGGDILARLFSPVMMSKVKDTPMERELFRLRGSVQVGFPGRSVTIDGGRYELTREEYKRLVELSGGLIKRWLERRVDNASWMGQPDETKADEIRDAVIQARKEARDALLPAIVRRIKSERKNQS